MVNQTRIRRMPCKLLYDSFSWILLLLSLLPHAARTYNIHDALSDTIGAGEVRYYTVESQSPLIVALFSDVGDADMYAAVTKDNPKPSCERYDVTSTSCGLDVILLEMNKDVRRMTVGVYGHVRYEKTKYRLYVIEPSHDDISKHQVWDWDPEALENKLVIDVDPLVLINDPSIHSILEQLSVWGSVEGTAGAATVGGQKTEKEDHRGPFEWIGIVLLKIVEIAIEILA